VHQDWLGFGPQRNFATPQAAHDWILALDADEYLGGRIRDELQHRLPGMMASDAAVGILRRDAEYMGAPMRWYRPMVGERLARLYHRDRARWTDARVDEPLRCSGASVGFKAPFQHMRRPTLVHKHLKVLRYAELKCRDWHDAGRPTRLWMAPLVYVAAFLKDWLLRLAILDGSRGLVVAHTSAAYAVYKRIRYYEMRRNPDSIEQARTALLKHGLDR